METARRAADRCERQLQQLEDAEKMLTEHVLAVESQTKSQRDYLIDAIDGQLAELRDELSHWQNDNTHRLHRNKEQIRKQKQILQCFEKFCQSVVDTGTVHELIHVYNSVHQTADEELPLQQVSSSAEIPRLRFTPVNVGDFLPQDAQHLIGSVTAEHASDESATQRSTWNELHTRLQQTMEQLDQLQRQINDNLQNTTCLEQQLADKTELLENARKELEEKQSVVEELERQMSVMTSDVRDKENALNSVTGELHYRDTLVDELSKQLEKLGRQLTETEQNYQSRLRECESKLEQTTIELNESDRRNAECHASIDQFNVRVQQLEESLSNTLNNEDQLATQLEDAWQQISEQSIIIEHVPPTAGQFCMLCSKTRDVYPKGGWENNLPHF